MPLRLPRRFAGASGRIRIGDVALAIVSYVPLLLTHPGKLGADTKTYLYIDPGRLLSRSPYLWDPAVGLGTVTHQNIGYLFPMGPYYGLMSLLHVPDWIAQRLWMGTVIFLAGLGVRYLLRTLRWEGPGTTVAAFAYALSPYLLHYIYKHSVILLPFTALPWLIVFSARAIRQGGWRYPSLFALVTLAAGGINATSLVLVMIGPFLWVLHSVFIERETTLRKVIPPLLRIGVLTLATSLWWMAGLLLQGRYGIDVLRYTETYDTVAAASTGPEVFRHLGYWFFYGTDALGPWFKSAVTETQSLPALALSFAVPGVAIVAALLTRFRYRIFFVGLAAAGMVVSIGAHPLDSPTLYGRLFNAFTATSSGLALRSAPRAEPMWILACAVFLGAGVAALTQWRPQWRLAFAAVALAAIVANMSPMWMGRLLDPYLERDVDAASYWKEAGHALDQGDAGTRALEIPGLDFAYYRWGASVDTILPGVTTRDTAGRELVPWGSVTSADMMNAVDAGFQDGSFDPDGYAALLRNLSVGDLVVRNDLQYERFKAPRPHTVDEWIDRAAARSQEGSDPGGATLGPAAGFGPDRPNVPSPVSPMIDDTELAIPPGGASPHAVEIRPVDGTTPIVSAEAQAHPTIVAGSADGIVGMADTGMLGADGVVRYSGSVSNHPSQLDSLLAQQPALVVTDTNRKAGHRWGSLRDQLGYTEMADESPVKADSSDARLDLFDRLDDTSTQTVVQQEGGLRVTASGYGNQLTFTPSDRAANAFDHDPDTAWKVGAFSDVRGEWIQARSTTGPITTDHIDVTQPQRATNRFITRVRLSFDGRAPIEVALDDSSRSGDGQVLRFPERSFTTLRITVLDTDIGVRPGYKGISGVGFSLVDLDGRVLTEVTRPPTDLLDAVERSAELPLAYVFQRQRTDPADPNLQSAEMRIVRRIDPPTARSFQTSGKVRLNTYLDDPRVDAELGVTGASGATYDSSGRLEGSVAFRSSKAFDDDPTTSWQSKFGAQPGTWLGFTSPTPVTADIGSLLVVNDAHHSVPAAIHVEVDGVAGPTMDLAGVPTRPGKLGTRVALRVPQPTVTGSDVRIVVDRVVERTTPDWYSGRQVALPMSIAEVEPSAGAPGPGPAAPLAAAGPADLPGTCRTDLVTLGDTGLPMRIVGTTADAEADHLLRLESCADASPEVSEPTIVAATDGRTSGYDVDLLTLASPGTTPPKPAADVPVVVAKRTSRGSYDLDLTRVDRKDPFWLVLGQTQNAGWRLTLAGKDLGPSQLVNGYANGWLVDPSELGRFGTHVRGTLDWAPQSTVWIALALSALGFVACLVLLLPRFAGRRSATLPIEPSRPVGIRPFEVFGAVPTMRSRLLTTAGTLVASLLFVEWWWAPVVAALCWLALSTRWGWIALRATCLALIGATAAYVVAREWRAGFLDDFDWPLHFEAVSSLPAAAIALLCVDAVVEALRAGWRRTTGLDP